MRHWLRASLWCTCSIFLLLLSASHKISIAYLLKTQLGWMPKETAATLPKRD